MLLLLLACVTDADTKLYSGGDYSLVFNSVDDGCAGGELADVFTGGAATMPDSLPGDATLSLLTVGVATANVEDGGNGALEMHGIEFGNVIVQSCSATLTVDIDLLVLSADELAGTGAFDVADCPNFDADPCTVDADLSFIR